MKKVLVFLFAMFLGAFLAGCGGDNTESTVSRVQTAVSEISDVVSDFISEAESFVSSVVSDISDYIDESDMSAA